MDEIVSLTGYLQEHANGQPLISRAMETSGRILALARTGNYEQLRQLRSLPDEPDYPGLVLAQAGVGIVKSFEFVWTTAPFAENNVVLRYGDRVPYMNSFAYRLQERIWPNIKERGVQLYGTGGWHGVRDDLWRWLKHDIAGPFKFTFWDDPDESPKNTPGENMLTTLFHLYAAAFADDEKSFSDIEGVARNLDLFIPIGEDSKVEGNWIILRAPTAVMVH